MRTLRETAARGVGFMVAAAATALGCGQSPSPSTSAPSGAEGGAPTDGGTLETADDGGGVTVGVDGGGVGALPDSGTHVAAIDGGVPSGWLYTKGGKIYVSNGSASGTPWVGRGVNTDDIYFCGYNNTLYMTSPEATLDTVVEQLITGWNATFFRVSLWMNSYPTTASWLTNPAQYKTPMTAAINKIGTHPGVYVLVTLRSDTTMSGSEEGSGLPAAATDPTYVALVDTFASASFVAFGLSNEPGGSSLSNATIAAAMKHAVGVIRAEEDKLGVPHHIVSVQGNGYTSDISFYAKTPLPYDNVVYEVHGYPPPASGYTYSNIPVIIGEYGTLSDSASFYADVEAKGIPNLAWDVDSFSDCAPDLVSTTGKAAGLEPTAWGTTVQAYLKAH